MFSGLAFLVNGKMCVNVSNENLMCRFDPALQADVLEKHYVEPMVMKGKLLSGYCYVLPHGYKSNKDFTYWLELCLAFNKEAKKSRK